MTAVSAPEHFIDAAAELFDALVPLASDDELFASGYLRGHFDLAVGTLQVAAQPFSKAEVIKQVNTSLAQAIANGELTEQDQQHVNTIWQRLQQLSS
ncbi:YfcL family protein [Rheinheimera maricola]|uniref:YfcL family protein n=1 Tax=Rheinheimera maricola TaxID=2793282 RepID=A0ABS7XA59_9GAMM|nr:YfcL family protein [Rheinheimera maricola]MBZ9611682.1 YfcL family protein [Rheinheimera maricola]